MRKKTIYIAIATLFIGISLGWLARGVCHFPRSFAFASQFRSLCIFSAPKRPFGPPGASRMVENLDLTAEQKLQIQTLDDNFRTDLDAMRKGLDDARADMESAIDSKASKEEIRPKFAKVFAEKQKVEAKHFELMMAVRDILTDEQKPQLQKERKERGSFGPPGFGGPGGPPPPEFRGGRGGPHGL